MATTWKIDGSTHGMACSGCKAEASAAISMAMVTGSVGCSHSNGNHAAKVTRRDS